LFGETVRGGLGDEVLDAFLGGGGADGVVVDHGFLTFDLDARLRAIGPATLRFGGAHT
jgi:hypothetical protein